MTRLQIWVQCPHCENLFKRAYYMNVHRRKCESKPKKKVISDSEISMYQPPKLEVQSNDKILMS